MNNAVSMMDFVAGCFMMLVLMVTFPIWIWFYLVYKVAIKIKELK